VHEEELPRARRVADAVRRLELDDARIAVRVGVVDVEEMILRVARMER
jgi:hypothetical protein